MLKSKIIFPLVLSAGPNRTNVCILFLCTNVRNEQPFFESSCWFSVAFCARILLFKRYQNFSDESKCWPRSWNARIGDFPCSCANLVRSGFGTIWFMTVSSFFLQHCKHNDYHKFLFLPLRTGLDQTVPNGYREKLIRQYWVRIERKVFHRRNEEDFNENFHPVWGIIVSECQCLMSKTGSFSGRKSTGD